VLEKVQFGAVLVPGAREHREMGDGCAVLVTFGYVWLRQATPDYSD